MNSPIPFRQALVAIARARVVSSGPACANTRRLLHTRATPPPLLRKHVPNVAHQAQQARQRRWNSADEHTRPLTDRPNDETNKASQEAEDIAARKAQEPAYEMTFTCRKCMTRSSHRLTKQAYHFGTTLITCPDCKNRHLISDHLKIFSDRSLTLEDILKEKGQLLKKGRLGDDGDVEFYDDEHKI